jgi:hypothetical protein
MNSASTLRSIRTGLLRVLKELDGLIETIEPPQSDEPDQFPDMPRTRAIEYVLAQHGRPMKPIEIWGELQRLGRDDPKSDVSITAYDLAERGRISRLGHGLYSSAGDDRTHVTEQQVERPTTSHRSATEPTPTSEALQAMPRTRVIEHVLAQHQGPMKPIEIWAELHRLGRDDPKSEVSVTAYDLWERGRLDRPGRGLYQAPSGDEPGDGA